MLVLIKCHQTLMANVATFAALSAPLLGIASAAPRQDQTPAVSGPFVVKPYIQLGDAPRPDKNEQLTLVWHTTDADADWTVEVKTAGGWKKTRQRPQARLVSLPGTEPHRVWTAQLTDLRPGETTPYRLHKGGAPVFESTVLPRRAAGTPSRFVVFGDCAADTVAQRKIAYQTFLAKPDFVFITGDIVYTRGRISEYRQKYFPVYNTDIPSPEQGAPLLRSTLFIAAPGNHDIGTRDFEMFPDSLAYYLYWKQPMNGPLTVAGAANTPTLSGPEASQKAFLASAGEAYPRLANFSFDYGDVHWTVLDSNSYVNWNDPALREWVRKDLEKAKNARWRFIGFHHPGFNSSEKHFNEQYMRLMAEVFEQGKVDVVFNGHVHNYQRSFPMFFKPEPGQPSKGQIKGEWRLDKAFDGKTNTRPNGVIYLVTGAGGANLYNPEQQTMPETWQGFTDKFLSAVHSLSLVEMNGKTLTVRQVSEDGATLDTFTIIK